MVVTFILNVKLIVFLISNKTRAAYHIQCSWFNVEFCFLQRTGSGMSTAKRKSILVSFYKSIVGTLFPSQEPTTSSQGTVRKHLNYTSTSRIVGISCMLECTVQFTYSPYKLYALPSIWYSMFKPDSSFSFCLVNYKTVSAHKLAKNRTWPS